MKKEIEFPLRWLVCMCLIYSGAARGQGQPKFVTVFPGGLTSEHIVDMMFFPRAQREGYALTSDGKLLHTVNGGDSWGQSGTRPGDDVTCFDFMDAQHGFVAGYRSVWRTDDAGKTWKERHMDAGARFKGITMLDKNTIVTVGLRSGKKGVVIRTCDGGETWKEEIFPAMLTDVDFGDAKKGVFVGYSGIIGRTEDGGATWTTITLDHVAMFTAVQFITPEIVCAIGSNGAIMRSADAGKTWYPSISNTSHFASMAFSEKGVGMISSPGSLLRSDDYGKTWQQASHPAFSADVNSLAFSENGKVYAAGKYIALKSADDGITWNESGTSFDGNIRSVHFVNTSVGVAAGYRSVIKTEDGGRNWKLVVSKGPVLKSIAMADEQVIVAVGDRGAVIRSSDGGKTWRTVNLATDCYLESIWFTVDGVGYIVGLGCIWKSEDRGATWKSITTDNTLLLTDVHFTDNLHGVATSGKAIRITADGGNTWQPGNLPPNEYIETCWMLSPGTILVGGKRLYRSTDNGISWEVILEGPRIDALSFLNDKQGIAIGPGSIYITRDGGNTWGVCIEDHRLPPAPVDSQLLPDSTIVVVGGTFIRMTRN